MRKLDMTRDVWKFLSELDAKRYKQVAHKMLSLADDATPPDSETLTGSDKRRTDIGEYRIIYSFDKECVYIALVAKRNDDQAYRELKRKK